MDHHQRKRGRNEYPGERFSKRDGVSNVRNQPNSIQSKPLKRPSLNAAAPVPLINIVDDEEYAPASKMVLMRSTGSNCAVKKPPYHVAVPVTTSFSTERLHRVPNSSRTLATITTHHMRAGMSNKFKQMDSSILLNFYESRHDPQEFDKRESILKRLKAILVQQFPGCYLCLIGSSTNGFGAKTSDLDMCLMIGNREQSRNTAMTFLEPIESVFRRTPKLHGVRIIKAIVPIMRFKYGIDEHDKNNHECDVSINNVVAIRNSHLLKCYFKYDSRVAPLVLFVKKWANIQEINSAVYNTLSSYSLTLMMIHYLQSGVAGRPVLPSLQEKFPEMFNGNYENLRSDIELQPTPEALRNDMSVGELFFGFLKYYSTQFRFDIDVASVRTGRALHIQSVRDREQRTKYSQANFVGRSTWSNARLFIEEPFNFTNVARCVFDLHKFREIRRVFDGSYRRLQQSMNVNDILTPFSDPIYY